MIRSRKIPLEALDACCVDPEELDGWLGPLRQFCAVTSVSTLRKPNGIPIAWRIAIALARVLSCMRCGHAGRGASAIGIG